MDRLYDKFYRILISFARLLVDGFVSIFVLTNLVVCIWRSIWDAQDFYVTKENKYLSNWLSVILSYLILLLVKVNQQRFYKTIVRSKVQKDDYVNLIGRIELKLYIWIFAFANINHWRGVWNLTLYYTNESNFGIFWIGFVCFISLCFIKRTSALLYTPFQVNYDCLEIAFKVQADTLYNVDSEDVYTFLPHWQYFMHFLYEYITDICTIQIWRSFWFFMDLYLLRNEPRLSAIISLIAGTAVYIFFYSTNKEINRVLINNYSVDTNKEKKNRGFGIMVFIRLIMITGFFGVVNIWRGLWMLQFEFTYPADPDNTRRPIKLLICVISVLASSLALFFMNRLSATLSRGNCKDDVYFIEKRFIVTTDFSKFLTKLNPSKFTKPEINDKMKKIYNEKNVVLNYMQCQIDLNANSSQTDNTKKCEIMTLLNLNETCLKTNDKSAEQIF